jgi:hypothetical protein
MRSNTQLSQIVRRVLSEDIRSRVVAVGQPVLDSEPGVSSPARGMGLDAGIELPLGPKPVTNMIRSRTTRSFSPSQYSMMEIIEAELTAAGLTPMAIVGAIANAIHESRLSPTAIGDKGKSVGLFQLNIDGAGSGMSVEERQDPAKNTQRIARSAMKSSEFTSYMSRFPDDPQILAAAFCRYVEKPKKWVTSRAERAATVRELLGITSISPGIDSV